MIPKITKRPTPKLLRRLAPACGVALAAVLGALSPAAQAQTPTQLFHFDSPGQSAVVYLNGLPYGVYAGRYQATLSGNSIGIFCTDFTNDINIGDSYDADTQYLVTDPAATASGTVTLTPQGYYTGGLASALNDQDYHPNTGGLTNAQRAGAVAWLTDQYLNAASFSGYAGDTNPSDNFAGVNLAIWDIVQDGGDGFANGAGQVALAANQSNYLGLADYYEGLAKDYITTHGYSSNTVAWLQAPRTMSGGVPVLDGKYEIHLQDYVTTAPARTPMNTGSAAPEPPFSLLLLCFGLVGVGWRLRRRPVRRAGDAQAD